MGTNSNDTLTIVPFTQKHVITTFLFFFYNLCYVMLSFYYFLCWRNITEITGDTVAFIFIEIKINSNQMLIYFHISNSTMAYLQLFRNNIRNVILWLEQKKKKSNTLNFWKGQVKTALQANQQESFSWLKKLDPNSRSWNFDFCPMTRNVTASKQMLSPQTPCFDRPVQLLMKLSNARIFH